MADSSYGDVSVSFEEEDSANIIIPKVKETSAPGQKTADPTINWHSVAAALRAENIDLQALIASRDFKGGPLTSLKCAQSRRGGKGHNPGKNPVCVAGEKRKYNASCCALCFTLTVDEREIETSVQQVKLFNLL
jgi:hypothetical protein